MMSVFLVIGITVISAIFLIGVIYTQKKLRGLYHQLEDEQKKVRELAVLNDTASILYKDLDEMSTIKTIVEKSKELIKSEFSAILLLENKMIKGCYTSLGKSSTNNGEADGILAKVISDGIPVRSRDMGVLSGCKGIPGLEEVDIRNMLIVPVIRADQVVGELILVNRIGNEEFSPGDEDLLLTLCFHTSFALEKARLHQEATRLATIDGLTGLNNHRAFQERLETEISRAERFKHNLSLLIMDVDFFKKFNDTYGHRAGDEILKRVACNVVENIRSIDFAARYGGDELVALLPETSISGANVTAEKIRETVMGQKIRVNNKNISATISVGVASYPEDAADREHLIECADKALYAAKNAGRNRVCIFRDITAEYL